MKINKLFAIIICILIFPIIVNADVAAPESTNYIVTVVKQEGTTLYDWEMKEILTIPSNEKLTISFETERDGILYGDVIYNGKYGYIKLSDTIANPEDIDFSNLKENYLHEKYYTFKETTMYNGPSPIYGTLKTTIPSGVTLEYEYYSILSDLVGWIYTEYNGTKGWVYVYRNQENSYYENVEKTVANKARDTERVLILSDDEKLHKEYSLESEEIYTLKRNTEYKYTYYLELNWDYTAYYIDDGKIQGWYIPEENYNEDSKYSFRTIQYIYVTNEDGVKVKENYTDKKLANITIPEKALIKSTYLIEYNDTKYYKIEYNGKNYWLPNSNNDYDINFYQYNIETVEDIKTYTEQKNTESVTETIIPKGTKVTSFYHVYDYGDEIEGWNTWYYIEYNNNYYWILDNNDMNIEQSYYEEDIVTEKETKEKITKKELTPKQIGLICTGGAIIVALVAIVTIKLINKKKKEVTE